MLIKVAFELLKILVKHVLPAKFIPPSKMIDLHMWQDAMLLKHPVYLLLLAPDDVPVIVPGLLPLSVHEAIVDAVFESCLELDAAAE